MAKKLDKESAAAESDGINAETLKRVVENINKPKEKASEYVGLSGKATAEAVDKYSLNRQALTQAAKLQRMDGQKRQAFLRDFLRYAHLLGHFDQIDALDDTVATMEGIARDARQRGGGGRKPDAVVSALN